MKKILILLLVSIPLFCYSQTIADYKKQFGNFTIVDQIQRANSGDTIVVLKDEILTKQIKIRRKKLTIVNPYNFTLSFYNVKRPIKIINSKVFINNLKIVNFYYNNYITEYNSRIINR